MADFHSGGLIPPDALPSNRHDLGMSREALAGAVRRRTAPARDRLRRVARFINAGLPELRRSILEMAETTLRGRILMPGSSELSFVGDPPDWFTPRYGDNEYLAKLNRQLHWKPLLQAYALTGDARFAAKVVHELDDWLHRTQPLPFFTPDGRPNARGFLEFEVPPWGSLELAFRLYDTWPLLIEQLAGTEHLPPDRLMAMAQSMAHQAGYLSLLSPLLWPAADHNHYFMEMLGLLTTTVMFPELPPAARWRDQAVAELLRCVQCQFTADGGHVEGCPGYHNHCVELLARFVGLAREADRPLPDWVTAVASGAARYALHSTRPTGTVVPWGDSFANNGQVDAVLWSHLITGEVEVLRQLAAAIGLERVRANCARGLWCVDDPAALFAQLNVQPVPALLAHHDRGNDQVMLRSSWRRDALSVFFACHSPLHPGSAHQHIDLGGFDFCAYGRVLVADPGPFTYRECDDRRIFKSAAYHSVLTIDERDHFEYLSRWRYGPQQEGRVTAVREEPGCLRIDSFHRSYAPAVCHRTAALIAGRWLAVIDRVGPVAPSSTVQIYFHLDSTDVQREADSGVVQGRYPAVRLAIHMSPRLGCELLPGRVSEQFDVMRPSTRVKFSDNGGGTMRAYLTVLTPWREGEPRPVIEQLTASAETGECSFVGDGREYRISCPGTESQIVGGT